MRKLALLWAGLLILGGCAMQNPQGDLYKTSAGDVYVLPLGHGSVQITWNGKIIQVDPYSSVADYAALPKADLVLITHDHYDHLDAKAWKETQKEGTAFIASPTAAKDLPQGTSALSNGDSQTWQDVQIDAVPAYNLVHKQPNGKFWHPKGWGNGYVLHFGDFRLYLGGDSRLQRSLFCVCPALSARAGREERQAARTLFLGRVLAMCGPDGLCGQQ